MRLRDILPINRWFLWVRERVIWRIEHFLQRKQNKSCRSPAQCRGSLSPRGFHLQLHHDEVRP
jgi:hypothetical protein